MSFSSDIKRIRLNLFLTQKTFSEELGVSVITINRWENGKAKPTLKDRKAIDDFCKRNRIDYEIRYINYEQGE